MEEISKKSTKKSSNFVKNMYFVSILYVEIFYCAAQTLICRLNHNNMALSQAQGSCNKVKFQ